MQPRVILFALLVAGFGISCEKRDMDDVDDEDEITTVEAEIAPNETYKYDLKTASADDAKITVEPQHAATSRVKPSGSTAVYEYAPNADFTGTENVTVVTGEQERHHSCGSGDRKHDRDRERRVHRIRINVRSHR